MRARSDAGATAVEYGLLLAGIFLVIAAVMFMLGTRVGAVLGDLAGWLDSLP